MDEYVLVDSKDENDFIKEYSFIYSKNYLDILDYSQLYEETIKQSKCVRKKFKEDAEESINMDKDIEYLKMKYKYNSLINYIKNRIESSCETCENDTCKVDMNRKVGLDKDGKPMGHNCLRYINKLQNVEKI